MDYSSILERIALSAEGIANAPTYWWIAIIAPITILISAGVGYWTSQRSINKQIKAVAINLAKKKELVFNLLRNEITLRWFDHIRKEITDTASIKGLDGLRRFSTMKFSDSDIFIFREVSRSFQEYYFLENTTLVSDIIHGYLLYTDLIDFNLTVNGFLTNYDQREKMLFDALHLSGVNEKMKEEFSDKISDLSSSLPNKINEIDSRFNSILASLAASEIKD